MSANALVPRCGFAATSTGTGDFVVSAALTGFMTPTAAGAINGQPYPYFAQSTDLTQWEVGVSTGWVSSSTTLQRPSTVIANSAGNTSKLNFTVAPNVYIDALNTEFQGRLIASNVYASSQTLTIPNGCTGAFVRLWGGGGAAKGAAVSGCASSSLAAAPSGAYLEKLLTGLTPGLTLALTIGAGGTGSTPSAGGDSSLASGTQTISTLTAHGGGLANSSNSGSIVFGTIPSATGGDDNRPGSVGTASLAPYVMVSVMSSPSPGGGPSQGASGTSSATAAGVAPGGGGVCATGSPAVNANGAAGQCNIQWLS